MKTPRNTVFSQSPRLRRSSYRRRTLTGSIAALLASLSLTSGIPQALAAPFYWFGSNGSSWSGLNWASDATGTFVLARPTATDDVTFSANGAVNQGVTTLDQNFTIHSLTITDTTPLVINSGGNGLNTLTIAGNAGTGITASTGTNLTINTTSVTLGGASDTITTTGTAAITINGQFAGSNGVVKNGTGTLTLNNTYTYTGTTTVNAGTLQVEASASLNGPVNLTSSTSQLVINTNGLVGQYYNAAPTQGGSGDPNFASLAALQAHLSTLTPAVTASSALAGADFFFGTPQRSDGLNFPTPYNAGNAFNLEVEWSGQFLAQTAGTYYFGTNSDDGSMIFIDGQTVVNNNFFQGSTQRNGSVTLTAGLHDIVIAYYQGGGGYNIEAYYDPTGTNPTPTTLLPNSLLSSFGFNTNIGALTGVAGSQVVLNGANLYVNEDVDTTFAGAIVDGSAPGGGLLKDGVGTLTLTGANTYTGSTTVVAGTLQLGDGVTAGASLATSSVTTESGATFTLNLLNGETFSSSITNNGHVVADGASASNNYTISGIISGSGDFTKNGDNTVTLTAANTYTGSTTINAGTLQLGDGVTAGASLASTSITANSGATFALNLLNGETFANNITNNGHVVANGASASNNYTISGAITGTGDFTKNGANTVMLTGANNYSGDTTINGGILQMQSGTTLTGHVNLTSSTSQLVINTSGLLGQYYNISPQSSNFASLAALQAHLSTQTPAVTASSSLAGPYFFFGAPNSGMALNFPAPYNTPFTSNLEVEWTGQFLAQTTGLYTFGTNSDDGSMIFIDGQTVVNNNNFQGSTTQTGQVSLTAGLHDIVIAYYQGGGGFNMDAYYSPNGQPVGPSDPGTLLPNSLLVSPDTNFSIGALSGVAGSQVVLNGAMLNVNEDVDSTFAGAIADGTLPGGSLTKAGPGTLTLTGINTYTGATTINAGALVVGGSLASTAVTVNSGAVLGGGGTITGPVTLNSGGFIAPGAGTPGIAGTTLHGSSVTWNGGSTLALQLGATGDQLALTGNLTKGTGTGFNLDLIDTGIAQKNYTLATFASTNFVAGDFTLALPPGYSAALLETSTQLELVLAASAGGSTIENAAPVGTPLIADFTVTGPVSTGGPKDNNTINSLIFTPGGKLTIYNTLILTSGNIAIGGGTNTITGGALFGPNGLHFDVKGNLFVGSTLIGNATLTGGGSFFLDGALFGNMNVLQGLLGGNGSIFGNLYNSSVVSPGHSPGKIQMSGNFVQSPSGLLQIQIGGRDITQHDLLSVGGTAILNGALQLEQLDGFKLKRNKPVTFLTAGEGVIGRFSLVENGFTSDTILEPTVVYHSNSVDLEAVQGSFADLAGLTPNQKAVAQALDSAANDRRANALFDYLDYRKLSELPRDFDKIAPEELTSMFTIGVSLANVQSGNIQRRTDDIRSGAGGFNAAGLAINGAGPSYSGSFSGVAGPNGNDLKGVTEVDPIPRDDNRWGAFLSGTGEWVSVGNTENARGYTMDSGGFTLGVDYKVTPNLAIGLAAGYTGTTADLTDSGRVYVNGGKIGLYATYYEYQQVKAAPTMSKDASKEGPTPTYAEARGLYADVAVFGGYNSYHTHRSALQDDATGDTDGGELNVLLGTGYDFKKGNFTFGPTASFNYTYLGTNAFTEHGSLAPLDVHGGKGESLRSAFGVKASYDWKVGGVLVKPEIRAAWQHEYGDTAYSLDSGFANGAGDTFRVAGPQLGRDSALLGAGFAIQLNERCSTYFYYDGELARRNYQSTSVTGGLRVAF